MNERNGKPFGYATLTVRLPKLRGAITQLLSPVHMGPCL